MCINMKKMYFSALITMLVVGFASVTANLVINGTINFGFNQKDFDNGVIFTYTNTMHGDATISEDKKTITFNTIKLEDVNQEAILDFDVTNKSLQYDASVTIECGLEEGNDAYQEYLTVEQDLESPFDLDSGATKRGRLTITLIKAYNDGLEQEINMACKLIATPEERTSEGTYIPVEHQYEEILLHGADPVISGDLIPVTIDDGGNVTRADTTTQWYDYETKQWANAVILNDEIEEPNVGEKIEEYKIESYFVWIPKYRYKLWNVGTTNPTHNGPFAIKVEFGTDNTANNETECVAPNKSGETGQCENGKWMTHPAFTSFGVNGFWVGKFEVGYKGANSTTDAQKDEENSTKVIVKPNVYSWRYITNKKMFNSLKGYATNLDSHMMKNTEWGAVAILSHTIYGINDDVAINNNSEYKTGYAKTNDSTLSPYPSQSGIIASTTGNITGIYDMSGGAWERMAAYSDVASTTDAIGSSEFTKQEILDIGEKYFDVYDKDSKIYSYEKRILGDATGEMGSFSNYSGSWYQDYAYFVQSNQPWFVRGGYRSDGSDGAGQFNFGRNGGSTAVSIGSRLVLSPKEG